MIKESNLIMKPSHKAKNKLKLQISNQSIKLIFSEKSILDELQLALSRIDFNG